MEKKEPANIKSVIGEVLRDVELKMEQAQKDNPNLLLELQSPAECNKCQDKSWININGRLKLCQCVLNRRAESIIKRTIPEIYADVPFPEELKAFKSLPVSVKRQNEIISIVKDNPLAGFFFLGPTGTGKSYLLWSLYKRALFMGRECRYMTCRDLLAKMRKYEYWRPGQQVDDTLIAKDVLVSNYFGAFHLFIDEWGKTSQNDYAYDQLFELIDYCSSNPSQVTLSIATNLSIQAFKDIYGDALLRRIQETCLGVEWGVNNG